MDRVDYNENTFLVESLRKGDDKAFAYLIDTFHRSLCVYANSLVRDIYSAEDIVQNVFLRVWKQRDSLKPDCSLKSFLYKSVYNEFIDHYRKKQSLSLLEKAYFEALNNFVFEEDTESWDQVLATINKEIENLPSKCKRVFILSKKEGLTNIEIAEYLNVSIKTVEAQITKAFLILRPSLKDKLMYLLFLLFGGRSAFS